MTGVSVMVVVHVDWLDGLRVDRLRVYRLRIRRCVVDVTLAVAHVAQRAEVHIFLSARTEGSSSAFGLAHVARTISGMN